MIYFNNLVVNVHTHAHSCTPMCRHRRTEKNTQRVLTVSKHKNLATVHAIYENYSVSKWDIFLIEENPVMLKEA